MNDEQMRQLPPNWALPLEGIEDYQVLYNGKFTYLMHYLNPHEGAWCHLLLLRSKHLVSRQKIAIITQVPDCAISIVNTIEQIATFVVNFFGARSITSD